MIINKVNFYNFMPYYGKVEFEFPLSSVKNVTIIYAPNDTGKSSIFNGILFAFYGADNNKKLKDYINDNAFKEKNFNAVVTIIGEHNGKKLEICRTIMARNPQVESVAENDFYDTIDIYENGKKLLFNNMDGDHYDYINAIIHKDIAKYFFFDGEKINTYHIASGSDNKEAIKRLLGLKEIENAQGDFLKIKSEYEKARDIILEDKNQVIQVLKDKKDIEKEINILDDEMFNTENELKEVKKNITNLEEDLKKYEELKDLIQQKQNLKKQKDDLDRDINKIKSEKKSIFKESATLILGGILADEISRDLNNLEENDNPTYLTPNIKEFIQELSNGKTCICGNEITKKQVEEINKYISRNFIEDIEYHKKIEKHRALYEILKYKANFNKACFEYYTVCTKQKALDKSFYEVNLYINKCENEIINFIKTNKINEFDEEQVEKIINNIIIFTQKQYELAAIINELKKKYIILKKDLSIKEQELSKFSNTDEKACLADKKLKLAEKINIACSEYLEKLTQNKREEVQENATKIFRELTNKPNRYRGLIITDNYSFKLQLTDGTTQEIVDEGPKNPSTGQKKIIGLSYIAAINQSSNSVAPIIIDNPLGLFSEEHRTKLVNYLSKFGEQVIFMVTKADLSEEYEKIIKPYVNCEYELEDCTDTAWSKTSIKKKVVY